MKTETVKLLKHAYDLQSDLYDLATIMEMDNKTKEKNLIRSAAFEMTAILNLLNNAIEINS